MKRDLFPAFAVFLALNASSAGAAPVSVAVGNIGAQTVGSRTFYSSTQLAVTWAANPGETVDHYVIAATDSVRGATVSMNAPSGTTAVVLGGLKAGTTYSVVVKSCADSACTGSASALAVSGTTSEEYWQLQGSGNGYASVTKAVAEGSVLSWVMRWGSEAGANAGSYQYYYKTNTSGREGIGIATASGTSSDASTPQVPFTPITTAGLRASCSGAPNSSLSSCPATGAYEINAIQAVPMTSGKVRAFFEASDLRNNRATRVYSIDSRDGLIGQDFHSSASQSYCGGIGSSDYASGGACELTMVIDGSSNTSGTNPLLNARQSKIGYDWNKDWRWDGASGTFMVITGEDTCNKYTSGLFYSTWDGNSWTVLKDSGNCAKALVPLAHGPVLVPLGGVAYKLYYEDATNGNSDKPLRLIYADGTASGDSAKVEFEDWESSSTARQVNFLWPDGSLVDAQDESGLGDHMILTPTGKLDKQLMFVNLGGFDNSKSSTGSNGLGMAVLLNPLTPVAPQSGWWWNPAESGRGFSIEVRGGTLFMAAYLYDTSGRASWYISSGALNADGSYNGELLRYGDGQSLTGSYRAPTAKGSGGSLGLSCGTSTSCILTWAGGSIPIQRLTWDSTAAPSGSPETGWWWNASESGRGYFLEQQGTTLFVSGYMYDSAGNDIWYIGSGAKTTGTFSTNWSQYGSGQTLTGTYMAPTLVSGNAGSLKIDFSDAATGQLTLPDGRAIPIIRFQY